MSESSSLDRSLLWLSPTPWGSDFHPLSLPYAWPKESPLIPWFLSPLAQLLTWLTYKRTVGTWTTPRLAFQGPARPGLEDLRVHLLLLPRHLLYQLLFLQHQFLLLPVPPLRAQTSWWWCYRAFTRVNTWWCRVYIVWLGISQLWAWRSFLCRWPG